MSKQQAPHHSSKPVLSPLERRPEFAVRPLHVDTHPSENYDAETDPYCPVTRTPKYKAQKVSKSMLTSKSQTFVGTGTGGGGGGGGSLMESFSSSLIEMQRPLSAPVEKFPKTQIANASMPTGGTTFSIEPSGNAEESKAELEVLKSILNREGYLNRLILSARTVNKKFKPEVADILDLVRAASLDVVESIVKWRETKKDHDAAFMWNNVNYLLKMPSDLDYLSEYLAIRKWMGFPLVRNPFCIPFPLEEGAVKFADKVLNPQHIEEGRQADGFMIGGLSQAKMVNKYSPKIVAAAAALASSSSSSSKNKPSPYGTLDSKSGGSGATGEGGGLPSSFILNSDMAKIRQSELVILKEEDKFGKHSKDPEGWLAPAMQAFSRLASLELRKDDRRPIEEPSTTVTFAPHAINSDIGIADEPWTPEERVVDPFLRSEVLKQTDESVNQKTRGKGKSGGLLAPLALKGVDTRIRKPIRSSTGSQVEFNRYRRKKTLGERLAEITALRNEVARQKEILEKEKIKANNKSASRGRSRQGTSRGGLSSPNSGGLGATSPPASRGGGGGGGNSRGRVGFSIEGETSLSLEEHSSEVKSQTLDELAASSSSLLRPEGSVAMSEQSLLGIGEDMFAQEAQEERKGSSNEEDEAALLFQQNDEAAIIARRLERISEMDSHLGKALEKLEAEEVQVRRELSHISKDEKRIDEIKFIERKQTGSERSRDIERKRRLLSEEEGKRKGPPPGEPKNAYDYYATRCQSAIRGWLTRCYTRWYREASRKACAMIQAAIRGKLGRLRVAKMKILNFAATQVQKIYRAYKARGASAALSKDKNLGKAATLIQTVYRGRRGKKRAGSKKVLDAAAIVARDSVGPQSLYVSDVQELGRRIQYAIEEPETSKFPPDEVLHLLRLSTVILQQSRGNMGLSEYTFINARYYGEVEGETMSWFQAAKMVNRAERLLRLVRAMAYGPTQKPPRIIQISPQASLMSAALQANPNWRLETFENLGMGSKFCVQLFKWLISVTEVAGRQQEFLSFLGSSFPDWLPKLYELQRDSRVCTMEIDYNTRSLEALAEFEGRLSDDKLLMNFLKEEKAELEKSTLSMQDKLSVLQSKELELCNQQVSREDLALSAMENKAVLLQNEFDQITEDYKSMKLRAASNDPVARQGLGEMRDRFMDIQLQSKEMAAQLKLLQIQVDANKARRLVTGRLPVEIKVKACGAGEARALEIIAATKIKVFFVEVNVKHAENLDVEHIPHYNALKNTLDESHKLTWNSYSECVKARQAFDEKLNKDLIVSQQKDLEGKDKVRPSDEELEEERREDDAQAQLERMKRMQYVPDAVLSHPHPDRPRPVIIAMGRDMPNHARNRIYAEVTRLMPGVFVYLDSPINMGLDIDEMQTVLDGHKSIIMMVDHGLTRNTRMNFLKSFEVTVKALIPIPFVIMAVGEDSNKRLASGAGHYGVNKEDLNRMRDCDIKGALEGMAWVTEEFLKPAVGKNMQIRAAQVVAPSQAFVSVIEALFVLQSGSENFTSPGQNMSAMSWRFTQRMLLQPRELSAQLKRIKRGGCTPKLLALLTNYTVNVNWPQPNSRERQADPLMHIMAFFIEQFLIAEKATLERGGMPLQPLSKNSMDGIVAVEVVVDSDDAEDYIISPNGAGWRMTAAKLVRVALQDLRVMKTVLKVGGQLLNVCAYREGGRIYLDTYDSATSQVHLTAIERDSIPYMLMPNAQILETSRPEPPQTPTEMYGALCKLLRFEVILKQRVDSRRILMCRRDYTFLRNYNVKLNGHGVFIKCFEAALGQLYFSAYIPEYGADVNFLLNEEGRLGFLGNADPSLEFNVAEIDDARKMLSYAIDRLKLSPSVSMIRVARDNVTDKSDGYRKKQGLASLIKAQGFSLKVRYRGGAGKILCRRIVNYTGVPHIVEARISTPTKLLIINAYEPRKRRTMQYRMPPFLRRLILGSDTEDYRAWMGNLVKRIKIVWRGEGSIIIDSSVHRAIRQISKKRMLVFVELIDENSVGIKFLDTSISETFTGVLNKEQTIRLLKYTVTADIVQKEFGVAVSKPAVREILKGMVRGPSSGGGEGEGKTKERDLDPSLFDVSFESILADHENLALLTSQLQLVVTKIKAGNDYEGYKITDPIEVQFLPVPRPTNMMEIDTTLRFTPRLKQSERVGTVEGVIRSRRQVPFVNMEEELNALALQKAHEAAAKLESDRLANEEIERQLRGIFADETLINSHEDEEGEGLVEGESRRAKIDDLIGEAAALTTQNLLDTLEQRESRRKVERENPGTTQEVRKLAMISGDGKEMVEVDDYLLTAEQRAILGKGEKLVYEGGVKTNFRDTKATWAGHVAVKVYENMCWMGEDGVGRRYRFDVYEPGSAGNYDGILRNNKHLKEVLGKHGRDLMERKKLTEMILFVTKFRMFVVDNTVTWDGEPNVPEAPAYRIEFESERIFGEDKITPINAGPVEDAEANKNKLFEAEIARGKKIARLVRRISGILMQLTIFEVATSKDQFLGIADRAAAAAEAEADKFIDASSPFKAPPAEGDAPSNRGLGAAEGRLVTKIPVFEPPTFKIIGYDPRSKRKAIYFASPASLLEVAGGIYSPYLEYSRRRELAKVACEALVLNFPKGKPFELLMNWSGAGKETTAAAAAAGKKSMWRTSAESVIKRPGKIFRTALKVGAIECIVTLYSQIPSAAQEAAAAAAGNGYIEKQLIVNFYARAATEATEVVVSDSEQVERLGRTILSYPDGMVRSAAVRRFLRFFHADVIEDVDDQTKDAKKILHVVLRPPGKDYLTEYMGVKSETPGENIRPVGIPAVFMPPTTCGKFLQRRGVTLQDRDTSKPESDFILTVYTKADRDGPEKGLVIKIYERDTSVTSVVHLGATEIVRLCDEAGEPDLLKDMVTAMQEAQRHHLDNVESAFETLTDKGELVNKADKLVMLVLDIIIADLGIMSTPQETNIPYLKSAKRGVSGVLFAN